MRLLTHDAWRKLLCESIDQAAERWDFQLVAFVMMPEHAHLLVLPTTKLVQVDKFLSAVKQPHSVRIKRILQQCNSRLLEQLTVQERPGKMSFRYWQEGPVGCAEPQLTGSGRVHAGMIPTQRVSTLTYRRSTVSPGTFLNPDSRLT